MNSESPSYPQWNGYGSKPWSPTPKAAGERENHRLRPGFDAGQKSQGSLGFRNLVPPPCQVFRHLEAAPDDHQNRSISTWPSEIEATNLWKKCRSAFISWLAAPRYEPRKLFDRKRNWRGVPTSFSGPVTFWGSDLVLQLSHLFLTAKCFSYDAYLFLGVFLPRFTSYNYDVFDKPGYAAKLFSIKPNESRCSDVYLKTQGKGLHVITFNRLVHRKSEWSWVNRDIKMTTFPVWEILEKAANHWW